MQPWPASLKGPLELPSDLLVHFLAALAAASMVGVSGGERLVLLRTRAEAGTRQTACAVTKKRWQTETFLEQVC